MAIKGVLQSLCDDAKVDSEKIGTSIYYWSYPSKEYINLKTAIEKLDVDKKERTNRICEKESKIEHSKIGKDDTVIICYLSILKCSMVFL